jgi:glycosyltransferase involved in cell wall biosynthesis
VNTSRLPDVQDDPPQHLLSVTVLIPAHNEAEHIERCVRSCWEQTHQPDHVVVIADSCTDETAAIASQAGARVVETDFKLKAANINFVLSDVSTDVVAIIDADSYYSPTTLENFARTIADGFDATCASLFPMPEQRTSMIVAYRRFLYAVDKRWGRPIQQAIGRFYVLAGPASAFRVSALRAVGGYPERKGEDAFLTWELYKNNYKLGYTGASTVYTFEPTSWKSYFKQTDRWHSDFCQLTTAYWSEYRKPRVLLVSGGAIWDTVTYPLVLIYLLASLAVSGFTTGGVPSVMWWLLTIMTFAQTVVAVKGLGFRKAMTYLPSFIVLGHVDIFQKFWVIIREWVLGRHAMSWTGRQGRKAVMTPIPAGRRRVFGGSSLLAVIYTGVSLITTASVLESIGVMPDLRIPEAVERAIDGGQLPLPALAQDRPEPERPVHAPDANSTERVASDTVAIDMPYTPPAQLAAWIAQRSVPENGFLEVGATPRSLPAPTTAAGPTTETETPTAAGPAPETETPEVTATPKPPAGTETPPTSEVPPDRPKAGKGPPQGAEPGRGPDKPKAGKGPPQGAEPGRGRPRLAGPDRDEKADAAVAGDCQGGLGYSASC